MPTPELCPKCDRTGVYWNDRHSAWMCHMLEPACNFWETEREHTARLRVSDPHAPEAPLVPDDALYTRCPTCRGSRIIPGSTMNSFACACAATPHPGFAPYPMPDGVAPGPATPHLVNVLRTDHARLLVALWDVASVDDGSEAAYLAASHVHGRSASVWLARKTLGLSLPDINDMDLPDHEGKKAEREERAARDVPAEPAPARPPGADYARLLVALYDLVLHSPLSYQLRPPQGSFASDEAQQFRAYEAAQRAGYAAVAGRGVEVEAARASLRPAAPVGATFADLAAGDHFIYRPEAGPDADRPVGLLVKIAGLPSTTRPPGYYNTQDHATGAAFHTPPERAVVPVSMGDFGKRPG